MTTAGISGISDFQRFERAFSTLMITQASLKAVLLSIGGLLLPVVLCAQTASSSDAPPKPAPAKSPWTFSAGMVVKESFDSNVFIQDHGDLANRQSWVTSLMSGVGAGYQDSPEFRVLASYSPEVVFYHSESSEDHVAHCGTLNLGGNAGDTTWDVLNGIVWIDGNNLGPRFTGGGDIPAIGGIPVRDRRDAAIYRSSIRVTQTLGKFFLRPTFNSYLHDFQTEFHQTTEPGFAGYENYISRYDIGGGLDAGYEVAARTWLVLGYRYGHQEQSENQFGLSSPFCNNYHRFLVGIEGAPTGWLKLNMMAGPDVRDFTSATPAGFDPNELLYFVDASASITPTRQDTVTVKLTRYEQPAFSSHSMYEDIVYDVSYRRKFNDRLTAGVGFKVYGGDWQAPVNRDDWIYTPSAMLACNFTKHLTGDLAYSYDWVDSEVPGTITAGREFTRHIVSLGLKYAF